MRAEQISDALNHLDDDLLQEAAGARGRVIKRRPAWQKWGALAACVALAVFAGTRLTPSGQPLPGPGEEREPSAENLPMITIQSDGPGAMGYEGYLAYDISELGGANPWTEEAEISFLPVYRNPVSYDEQHQVQGADWDKMRALLLDVAEKLGLDTRTIPITDNTPDEEYQKAVTEKMASVGEEVPEGYFDPTTLIMEGDGVKIEVDQSLTAKIDFDPPVELPEGYRFSYSASREEMKSSAEWLAEEYGGLLSGMAEPVLDQGMADRNVYGERSFSTVFYDGAGSTEEQIVNFSFNQVAFYNNDDGKLFLARVYAPDLSDKMGDYPIISAEEAKELLLAGNYATSVPCEMPGEEHIAKVELVYRTSHERVWLPYYRFLAELPEEYSPSGTNLRDFGAYYVPAVEGQYITNMPTYDGHFN